MKRSRSAGKGVVFSNLTWNTQVAQRLNPEQNSVPGWFGRGILLAGHKFCCRMNPVLSILRCLLRRQPVTLLCFNPSLIYGLLFFLPLPVNRVSLFQWRPLSRLSALKALFVWFTLRRSHAILVYSHTTKRYLRRIFPEIPIRQIGLYVDTTYFYPDPVKDRGEDFLLVPGDHKRDESLLVEIAERLGTRIVRVTRNETVRRTIESIASEAVDLRFNVSFDELRALYQSCRAVLILSDSSEIPTGITTLAEALACGADVVISRGHSCSWPPEIDKSLPFVIIPAHSDVMLIIDTLRRFDADPARKAGRRKLARDFAEVHLSESALARQWYEVLDALPHRSVPVACG